MKVSANGIAVMHRYEGCKLKAYPDPKTGGAPWTIGWGHTGPEVVPGLVWTQEKADQVFIEDLQKFERGVMSLVKVPLSQGQFDALVSFAYNLGLDIDADDKAEGLGDSTLLRKLNAGDYHGAGMEFGKWISKGTPVEKGLRKRRGSELALFNGADGATAIRLGEQIK